VPRLFGSFLPKKEQKKYDSYLIKIADSYKRTDGAPKAHYHQI
jgi:hypothetical protein